MSKYGLLMERELAHHIRLHRIILKLHREAIRCFKALRNRTDLQAYLMSLSDLYIEYAAATVRCFKEGWLTTGLTLLRTAQEVSHKQTAIHIRPSLVKKKQIRPKEVREILRQKSYSDWGTFYNELCDPAHQNKNFLWRVYGDIRLDSPTSDENLLLIEYYLMILNILGIKALRPLYVRVFPFFGQREKDELVTRYNALETVANVDWDELHEKVRVNFES